jgi:stringent starvation protein B
MPVELPPKKEVALALLENSTVFIHLDPRADSVHVPAWFKKQPQLVLQIGLNMAIPIHDLSLDDDAVSCTLSFNRSPFFCRIPWPAVFALIGEDRRGMVWPNDVPPEVAVQVEAQARREQVRAEEAKRPGLRVVPPEAAAAPPPPVAPVVPAQLPAPKKRARSRKPAAAPAAPEAAPPAKKPRRSRKAAPAQLELAPKPAPVSPSKRPLPPYLRVVK